MTKFRSETAGEDGWSEWVHPLPGYKFACCDCGLVHDMEFRIDDLGRINIRARRNSRSTGQMRRHNNITVKVDGNYEPGNCRWATRQEQRANQRRSGVESS